MAATATLSDMETAVRELADLVGAESRASSAAVRRRINDHLKALYDLLVDKRGGQYYAKRHDYTTVADQSEYPLPADFMQSLAVMASDGSRWTQLGSYMPQEEAELLNAEEQGGARSMYAYRYRLTGTFIEIRPAPSVSTHTIRMRYVPAFVPLSGDGATFDGVNGWERFAVLGAAIDLMQAEESDVAALMAERAEIRARINSLGGARDAGRPPRVQCVADDESRPRRSSYAIE